MDNYINAVLIAFDIIMPILGIRKVLQLYQTKEGKKKVMRGTLDILLYFHLFTLFGVPIAAAFFSSKLSVELMIVAIFMYPVYCAFFLGLALDFIHERWDLSINNNDNADPVDEGFNKPVKKIKQ